jgi:hypothetical protein
VQQGQLTLSQSATNNTSDWLEALMLLQNDAVPFNWLPCNNNDDRVNDANVDGMVPVRALSNNSKNRSLVNVSKDVGIVPVKALPDNCNKKRAVNESNHEGILPFKALPDKSK